MLLLNLPFLLVGYLVKFGMFIVRGYGRAYWQGTREGTADLPPPREASLPAQKLPNYILIQFWLIGGFFKYAAYRIGRALGVK